MTTNKGNRNFWGKKYKPKKENLTLGLRTDEPKEKFDIVKALIEREIPPKPERKRYTGDFIDGLIERARAIIFYKIVRPHQNHNEMSILTHQEINHADNPTILAHLDKSLIVKYFNFPTAAGTCYVKVYQDSFNAGKRNNFYFYVVVSGYETRIIEINLKYAPCVKSCVYLAEDGRYFKIGKARDIERREKELKTANPLAKMIAYIEVDEMLAYERETAIKKMFSKFKHLREWYHYDQSIIDYFYKHGTFLKDL